METLNEEIGTREVYQICARHKIGIKELKSLIGSFDKKIFFINNEYLLRVSKSSMAVEQEKFSRVDSLLYAPKIIHAGVLDRDISPVHYTLLTLLPGDDFVNVYTETSSAQQIQLGKDVAAFLDSLYAFEGTHYDIGHYLPAIPNFSGTWREGREKYWEKLKKETEELQFINNFFLNSNIDICFMLSICNWIHNWKKVIDFCYNNSKHLLFESNGKELKQREQIQYLKSKYKSTQIINDKSLDDPRQHNRKLIICKR